MTPRAVSPRDTSNRESFGRSAPEIQPKEGEAAMAPDQQHQQQLVTAETFVNGREAGESSARGSADGGGTEKALASSGSRSEGSCCVESEADGDVKFKSSASFGSVTQETPTRVRSSTWTIPFMKPLPLEKFHDMSSTGYHSRIPGCETSSQGGCCCDCVAFSGLGGASLERPAGAPETFTGISAQRGAEFTGKSGFRPRHRRGHSTGSIAHTSTAPPRAAKIAQPRGWEGDDSSTDTSAWSSGASASLAAAASIGVDDGGASGGGRVLSGGRTGISVGGVNSLDREFQRVLKAGVDVFKHSSTNEPGQWADLMPRRLRGLLTRRCPLDDESQGLVTLFFDKGGEHLCWCAPGAAELVPDDRYRLKVRSLVKAVMGDELHPRFLSLRAIGRPNPLVIELDSDELYDMVAQGIARILERNHIRDTLMSDSPASTSV